MAEKVSLFCEPHKHWVKVMCPILVQWGKFFVEFATARLMPHVSGTAEMGTDSAPSVLPFAWVCPQTRRSFSSISRERLHSLMRIVVAWLSSDDGRSAN